MLATVKATAWLSGDPRDRVRNASPATTVTILSIAGRRCVRSRGPTVATLGITKSTPGACLQRQSVLGEPVKTLKYGPSSRTVSPATNTAGVLREVFHWQTTSITMGPGPADQARSTTARPCGADGRQAVLSAAHPRIPNGSFVSVGGTRRDGYNKSAKWPARGLGKRVGLIR
jgi:hypothetical protein